VKIPPFRPFPTLLWPNYRGIRLLNGLMRVRISPAAPINRKMIDCRLQIDQKQLPDSVKVARRPVKPFSVGASPTLAANLIFTEGRQIKAGCACPENRICASRGRRDTDAFRHFKPEAYRWLHNERNPMRPVNRYRSQLLFRKSYRPLRFKNGQSALKLNLVFKPSRGFGAKPEFQIVP
jgi:hypothetical protein